ncbi:class F sortase [Nocardioides xinjiangensis]|uniref:class F sortase n=1 Tax=Nocardioides xinjiangensis TaxID=2817376 RepID=UPI001B308648|nr:class F sortase [Nocardioides sp. SYSU D00514]
MDATTRWTLRVAATVLAGAALSGTALSGTALAGPGAGPGLAVGAPVRAAAPAPTSPACGTGDRAFAPRQMTIREVVGATRVLALGRDRGGVPRTPPLTDRGKWQVGWDRQVAAGAPRGVMRLTAHTYPRDGSHGLALGNRLLSTLSRGDRLVVAGGGGDRLCYRVTRRLDVRAERTAPAYYASTGRHRLAILVCSGTRRGPGDWSHRTIWFAEPVQRS